MTDKKAEAAGKSWYKSVTVQAVLAAVVVLVVLPRVGVELPAEYLTEIYGAVAAAVVLGLRNASGGGLTK